MSTLYCSEYGTHSYASQPVITSEALSQEVNYKYGDYLSTINQNNVKGLFMVPGVHSRSGTCLDRTPARFLVDTSVTCTRELNAPLFSLCATEGGN